MRVRTQKCIRSAGPLWGLAIALFAVVAAPSAVRGQEIVAQAQRPVSFTADQADRGKRQYVKHCIDCHGKNLSEGGLNGGPPLKGRQFEMKFGNGTPASALFVFMKELMPPKNPGRFSAAIYADLMAYILKRNGYRAGAPLPSDVDLLDNLIIEK